MSTVTIRGSIMPSAALARGVVKTVQRTAHIDNLIRQGFVDVIAEQDDDTPKAAVVSPEQDDDTPKAAVVSPEAAVVSPEAAVVSPEPAAATTPYSLDKPPSKGGSREDWAEFLASFPEVGIVTEGKGRDQLVGEWELYQDEHPAPAE